MEKIGRDFPDSIERVTENITVCRACTRLVEYRETVASGKRAMYRSQTYWGRPVPGFGDPDAILWIVGLAPAAHGGNRTGRVFTGDRSGDFLFRALFETGWAKFPLSTGIRDGQELFGCYISAAVRCAPPENKPDPDEFERCRTFLEREGRVLAKVKAVLALGKMALGAWVQAMRSFEPDVFRSIPAFRHGHEIAYPDPYPRLYVSYHPSQRNTQTGLLTRSMMTGTLSKIRTDIQGERDECRQTGGKSGK